MLTHGGGSIINTASMSGHIVDVPQSQCGYGASKGCSHTAEKVAGRVVGALRRQDQLHQSRLHWHRAGAECPVFGKKLCQQHRESILAVLLLSPVSFVPGSFLRHYLLVMGVDPGGGLAAGAADDLCCLTNEVDLPGVLDGCADGAHIVVPAHAALPAPSTIREGELGTTIFIQKHTLRIAKKTGIEYNIYIKHISGGMPWDFAI